MSSFTRSSLDAAGTARLDALRAAPDSAGTLIYQGAVFAPGTNGDAPMFTYERRVAPTATGLASAHITRDTGGEVILAESAQLTPDYALQRFDAANRQSGYSGTVVVSQGGRHLAYVLNENGKLSTASEDVSDPVVSGPSLHGFVLHHWNALAAGQRLAVRMIVLTKKETYGFHIRRSSEANGRTAFTVTPSSLLVRLAVAPLTLTFDSSTRNVVRYEGRVPPMQALDGKLKPLDARVEYVMQVAAYR